MTRTSPLLFIAIVGLSACGGVNKQSPSSPASAPSEMGAESRVCRESHDSSEAGESEAVPAPASEGYAEEECYPAPARAPGGNEEIARLWDEIRELRVASGLPAEPLTRDTFEARGLTTSDLEESLKHKEPKSERCIDTCKLETSICDNAVKICRIADELGNDEWASEKCDSGKASCKEANQQCVDCIAGESAVVPD